MSITFDLPGRGDGCVGRVNLNGGPVGDLFDHGSYYGGGDKRWSVLMWIRSVHVDGYGATPAKALADAIAYGRALVADVADALDEIAPPRTDDEKEGR